MSILGFRPKQRDAPYRCPKHDVRYALRRDVNQGTLVRGCPVGDIEDPWWGPERRRGFEVEAGRDGQGAAILTRPVMKR